MTRMIYSLLGFKFKIFLPISISFLNFTALAIKKQNTSISGRKVYTQLDIFTHILQHTWIN